VFLRCGKTAGFGVWRDAKMFQEGGAWRMVENLQTVSYDRPPYSTRYPALRQLARDFQRGVEHILQRELPKDNLIRRNVSRGGVFLHLGPLASLEHVRVEGNVIADDVVFTGSFDGSGKGASYRNGDAIIAAEFGKGGNVIVKNDPGFRDLATQDFSLGPDSPAWKLGFEPIPFKQIGLMPDEYRKALPLVVCAPVISPSSRRFQDKLTVRITSTPSPRGPRCMIRYTVDGTEPTAGSQVYSGPITIMETATLKAVAFVARGDELARSETVVATFITERAGAGGGG
jgi:hypothetical protein